VDFMKRFEELEPIREYLLSERFKQFPIWSERSFFGRVPGDMP
jgi:hypothetical protein